MKYQYEAMDRFGTDHHDVIRATNEEHAFKMLREKGLFPIRVKILKEEDNNDVIHFPRVKLGELIHKFITSKDAILHLICFLLGVILGLLIL